MAMLPRPVAPLLISGGRVIDPASGTDRVADVALADGRVAAIGPVHGGGRLDRGPGVEVIDAAGCIASAGMMARALAYIKPTGRALMQHCQEPTLTRGSSMHAGSVAVRLGLTGWPRIAEEVVIERDVRLNRSVGCRYHVQHLSSGE